MRSLCPLSSTFHKALHQPKVPKSQLVLAVPRNQMLQWAPGSRMYPG